MLGNKVQSIHYTCSCYYCKCVYTYTVHDFKVQKCVVLMHLVVDS